MEPQFSKHRSYGQPTHHHHHHHQPQLKMSIPPPPPPPPQHSENDRSCSELRAFDCNLNSLCEHIRMEGFNGGSFSDIVVNAMGSTYHLHRLILSRSSYFRNMLHGPWKEANSPVVTLNVDDSNVNGEAIAVALAYLYGHHPKLNDNNAFRVLAAASFLDLQDLCAICTDFIISELWTSNFLAYQVFAENQDYGIHGERVRSACWGYLCQSGAMELKEVLPKLSSQTLHALLTSDELWVSSEEKRFELAFYTLLAKGAFYQPERSVQGSSSSSEIDVGTSLESSKGKGKNLVDNFHGCVVDIPAGISSADQQVQRPKYARSESLCPCSMDQSSSMSSSFSEGIRTSHSYVEMPIGDGTSGGMAMEGPSEEGSCYQLNNNNWLASDQSKHCSSEDSSCSGLMLNDWGRCSMASLSWGGRVVGKRQVKSYAKGNCGVGGEDYDAFVNIFEGGSLLYCNMSFEALLNVRKQLEELGFPCKALNDGLWLQMLLRQRVQEIGADTCKNCCLTSMQCSCRQPFGIQHGVATTGYYVQEHDQSHLTGNIRNVYVADNAQDEGNGLFRPVRVQVRGAIDGLAGIGRGATSVPATLWTPTRFVFSRVPFGMGNRIGQQSPANEDSEARADHNGDMSGGGLTALVELSQGGTSNAINVREEQTERSCELDPQSKVPMTSIARPATSGIAMQMLETPDRAIGIDWENATSSSISLDLKTPLSHFPSFRFGVQFEDVHRLSDGQVKHSPEFFYAGSLWKVSVQAFNDEDPQGRRTLGLFLHRRKAEITDSLGKVHMFIDSREKVTARYQLICPSKRDVMVFGSFKQRGTLLPKAPKGWGWRTALLFDELADLLQNGALRVAAVVQLV
ncbi:hypothetical protein E1A91_D02G066900v1 [Gossypium mustelinum]|uniref:BTB domain-containing protein n=1 Tax=Gossypium mustelinum TaxID=34275 RepID=A0A5D2VSR4_GOSMU|nr:hypothetical protein E1A91_D02G066900v1 [Gossypium mustelinum]